MHTDDYRFSLMELLQSVKDLHVTGTASQRSRPLANLTPHLSCIIQNTQYRCTWCQVRSLQKAERESLGGEANWKHNRKYAEDMCHPHIKRNSRIYWYLLDTCFI